MRDRTQALVRVRGRLAKAGVRLRTQKDVPVRPFYSDNPDVMIRKLKGKVEHGILIDGALEVAG